VQILCRRRRLALFDALNLGQVKGRPVDAAVRLAVKSALSAGDRTVNGTASIAVEPERKEARVS
jgi:hypothetical protein